MNKHAFVSAVKNKIEYALKMGKNRDIDARRTKTQRLTRRYFFLEMRSLTHLYHLGIIIKLNEPPSNVQIAS